MNPFKFDMVPYTRGVGIEICPSPDKTYPHFIKWQPEGIHLLSRGSFDFAYYYADEEDDYIEISKALWGLIKQGGYLNIIFKAGMNFKGADLSGTIIEEVNVDKLYYYALRKGDYDYIPAKNDEKTCAIVRYGGIGDMMFMSCVLPELKEQGFHITLYTHPNSYEAVKKDPHIDRFILQDSGQVPIEWFRDFCIHTNRKYDRFINLSESIEGTLLSLPDRVSYYWPKEVRHEIMNRNYYELTAKICGVNKNLCGKFYATEKEKKRARKFKNKHTQPVIVWILSGSSVHKFWPHQDQAIARILLQHPHANIIMVGDDACRILEQGWENEPRVHMKSGKWSVRETMAFCQIADLIITPETGVSLGVQFEDVPKILLLSHSSRQNYAEDWVNCITVPPEGCDCYPCHQMHYGFEYCNQDEKTGASLCQTKIGVDEVIFAVNRMLTGMKKVG